MSNITKFIIATFMIISFACGYCASYQTTQNHIEFVVQEEYLNGYFDGRVVSGNIFDEQLAGIRLEEWRKGYEVGKSEVSNNY